MAILAEVAHSFPIIQKEGASYTFETIMCLFSIHSSTLEYREQQNIFNLILVNMKINKNSYHKVLEEVLLPV